MAGNNPSWVAGTATHGRQTIALIDLAVPCRDSAERTRMEGAMRRLDGLTLLEWCVRRLRESTLIDTIAVTGPQHYRERIGHAGLCSAHWIPSLLQTPTQRATEIAERFQAEWIVFASPLCPFTDPTLLDRLVSRGWANPDVDFVGFLSPKRPDFSLQSLGLVGEMCSVRALQKLTREGLCEELCDVPEIVRRNSNLFQSKLIPLPEELSSRDLRFQLETLEDRDRAASFLEAAGDDLCWQRLAQVADRIG
jgi:spore coat polysaccharide biosynthesis protein SpsF (cytidylyltransferase family)